MDYPHIPHQGYKEYMLILAADPDISQAANSQIQKTIFKVLG